MFAFLYEKIKNYTYFCIIITHLPKLTTLFLALPVPALLPFTVLHEPVTWYQENIADFSPFSYFGRYI